MLSGRDALLLAVARHRLTVDRTPSTYWPRTTSWGRSHGCSGRIDRSSFTFSSRTASASKLAGGSIAVSASTWSRWFCTMSRSAPACS